MTAADVNSVVDNVFYWLLGIFFLLWMLGAFDRE